jgi:hypothetical protein
VEFQTVNATARGWLAVSCYFFINTRHRHRRLSASATAWNKILSLKCNLKHNESDGGNAGKWEMGLAAAAANTHTHRLSRGFLRACGTRGSWHIPIFGARYIL